MTLDHEFSPEEFATWLSFALVQCGPDAKPADIAGHVARAAYRAGADRELGECEDSLRNRGSVATADRLLEARRPKQPEPTDALAKLSAAVRDIQERIQPVLDLHYALEGKKSQPAVTKADAVSALHKIIGALYSDGSCEPSDIGLIRLALDQLPGKAFSF